MDADNKKIQFFRNKILARIEDLRPDMSDTKYKLYKTMINDCNSYSEIREMAELDLQFNMIKYIKELEEKLRLNNTNIEELEAVTNQSLRAAKFTVIASKKKEKKTNLDIMMDVDLSTLSEDIEDEEILASAANILMMRIKNAPPEELYSHDLDNYEENELTEDAIDNLDIDINEMYPDNDEDDEDDIELEFEDGALEALEDLDEEDEEEKPTLMDASSNLEDYADGEDDELDFGMNDQSDEGVDIDNIDSLDIDDWDNSDDEYGDDNYYDEEDNIGNIDTDELFIENDDEDYNEDDIDNLDMDDIFVEEDEDDSNENDIDSMDTDDLFIESDEDESDEDDDIDSMDTDDIFMDSDDEDEEEEDSGDIDSIDTDDLFGDDDEDEYNAEDDEEANDIDNIDADDLFGDDDYIDDETSDINDRTLKADDPEDDFEAFFSNKNSKSTVKREITPNKVFINGTKRGKQTQDMFNFITSIIGKTEKTVSKASNKTRKTATAGLSKINNSSFFNLDDN